MDDDMPFVEGTFRLPGGEWQVLIFIPEEELDEPNVDTEGRWESGVRGVCVYWPRWRALNKTVVEQLLSSVYSVAHWIPVKGPDSMILR